MSRKAVIYCHDYHSHLAKDIQILVYNVALSLKKKYNTEIISPHPDEYFSIGNDQSRVHDGEILIYYPEDDVVKALSFSDTDTPLTISLYNRNKSTDTLIVSQNASTQVRHYDYFGYKFNSLNTIYTPESPVICLDNFYVRRQYLNEFRDKFVFRGNTKAMPRLSPSFLEGCEYFEGPEYLGPSDDYLKRDLQENYIHHLGPTYYFYSIIECKVGLAIPGMGEICNRDIEYMAIGLPMMKFEYMTKWNPELIPNYHYISIPRICDTTDSEQVGSKEHAEAYLKRFLEVKDDKEFLDFVSKNARQYYWENIHPLNRTEKIVKLLEF